MAYISGGKYYKVLTYILVDDNDCSEDCPFVNWDENYCNLFREETLKNQRCYECRRVIENLKDESAIIDLTKIDEHLHWFKFYFNREKTDDGVKLEDVNYIIKQIDNLIKANLIKGEI